MGILTNEEIKILDDNKHLYEMIVNAGYCRNYTKEIYLQLSAIHEKHIGKHNFNHWCSECRMQLVVQLYRWYDQQSESNYNEAMKVFASITNEDVEPVDQPVKKKRGRKPKNEQP